MAELNFGYNGSENFAKGNRFGFFPSIAMGYTISAEPWFEPLESVFSYMKLRGSYGLVGNDRIGAERFIYMSDINLSGIGYTTGLDMNYGRSGPVYNRYANYDLTWETGKKLNLGVDFHLLNDIRSEEHTSELQSRGH